MNYPVACRRGSSFPYGIDLEFKKKLYSPKNKDQPCILKDDKNKVGFKNPNYFLKQVQYRHHDKS